MAQTCRDKEAHDDTLDYLSLVAYEREIAVAMKEEDELPV
jgi:hypothetical protein